MLSVVVGFWLFFFLIASKITCLQHTLLALENATWAYLQRQQNLSFSLFCYLLAMLTGKSCCSCCNTSLKTTKQRKNKED